MEIERLVRENIRKLKPYSCARNEYGGNDATFLDANENPFENGYNRYPDPSQIALKAAIAPLKGVAVENIVLGNGSDELIDLLIRSFCNPGLDNVIVFSPGYSMYEVCAAINDVEVRKINLTADFLPDWQEMGRRVDGNSKVVFLCSPNNPTGAVIPCRQIEQVCMDFSGIVLVDEAYIDFTDECSAVGLLDTYPNLVVLQTFSKAWGMAGLRLGMCFANPGLVRILDKVRAPYNIGSLTQRTALEIIGQYEIFRRNRDLIKAERARMIRELKSLRLFERVYDSEANFILVIYPDCGSLYRFLTRLRIVVRLRDIPPGISGGIRITVGTPRENDRLLEALALWKLQGEERVANEMGEL